MVRIEINGPVELLGSNVPGLSPLFTRHEHYQDNTCNMIAEYVCHQIIIATQVLSTTSNFTV